MRKLIAAMFVIAVLGGCSSDDSDDAATSTTVTVPTSGLDASTTVGSGAGTTSTVAAKPKFTSAEKAAAHLFNAWRAGNRNQALEVAEQTVVNTLFSHPANGPAPSFEGCEQQPPDRFVCAYRYEGGGMIFRVQTDDAIGYRVIAVDYVAD